MKVPIDSIPLDDIELLVGVYEEANRMRCITTCGPKHDEKCNINRDIVENINAFLCWIEVSEEGDRN